MAFTARHYNEVARIIRNRRECAARNPSDREGLAADAALCNLIHDLRRMFAADNPRFDGTRFDMACEPKQEGGK